MSTTAAFIAATRFGLGPGPGELEKLAPAPQQVLETQLGAAGRVPAELRDFQRTPEIVKQFQKGGRKRDRDDLKETKRRMRQLYMDEAGARTLAAIRSDAPLVERLVAFWSNHFTVSIRKPLLSGVAGAYEREAIRPHVGGRFADMLLAVTQHPAMLYYLDNHLSFGPNSVVGRRRDKGLNENLAREILELHTLGVDGGYGQRDVEALARILTGWSAGRRGEANSGTFRFYDLAHEPGAKSLLGRNYAEGGEEEGRRALFDLARHPATAHHIATKLARHFIADDPPATAVNRLARLFLDTDGDLGAMARGLIAAPEAWQQPLAKIKSPNDYVVSALRPVGFTGASKRLVESLSLLGQAPFDAPSPAGWPDTAEAWLGPNALMHRIEWAYAVAERTGGAVPPGPVMDQTIGPVVSPATRQAIARAADSQQAFALLLASPEFQRR
ncbi:MAG: DUF1800 domain-containing protein [Alphaproteobacteria bacterium]|nr:DUF1800 domain-containing protein [Alphaproteobacteria bacterium]